MSALLVALLLMLHSATGHAAVEGDFTVAELLQLLHLSGMALWTGGVIVAGLFVLPRLVAAGERVDAWIFAGPVRGSRPTRWRWCCSPALWKGWTGLDHQLGGLVHTGWGRILLAKLVLVAGALALGALHRRWIRRREQAWTTQQTKTLGMTLRVEAVCLTLVLVLSAWLGSVDPSGS